MSRRVDLMNNRVDSYEWSVRTEACLKHAGIVTIRDLVSQTEKAMLRLPNFGGKSLVEVKEFLLERGLRFGLPPNDSGSVYSPFELERMSRLLEHGTIDLCLQSVRDHVNAALAMHRISHFNRSDERDHHVKVVEARMAEIEFIVRLWAHDHGGQVR